MNVCSAYNHHSLPVNPFFMLQIAHGRKFFQNTKNFGAIVNDRFPPFLFSEVVEGLVSLLHVLTRH